MNPPVNGPSASQRDPRAASIETASHSGADELATTQFGKVPMQHMLLERASDWVAGLGTAEILHRPRSRPERVHISATEPVPPAPVEHNVSLIMRVETPSASGIWATLQRFAGMSTQSDGERAPNVSLSVGDLTRIKQIHVSISNGHPRGTAGVYFIPYSEPGMFSVPSAHYAEALAFGAFLGLAISSNPTAMKISETQRTSTLKHVVTPNQLSTKELIEIGQLFATGAINRLQLFETGQLLPELPSAMTSREGRFATRLTYRERTVAEISIVPSTGNLTLETFDEKGRSAATCQREYTSIPALVAAAIGARLAMQVELGRSIPR